MVKIIGIVSAKGGVGKTVTTCNLGIAFASKFNKKVIIMDCNLTTSHISLYLGMNLNHYSITLNNVLRNEARLEQAVYYYPFGLGIVPTSTELKDLINVEISDLKTMIKETFIGHDIVLLDAAPCLGREALITLQTSDEILFVANPTIPSVVDITKCLEVLKELKANPVGIVLNRVKNHKYELNEREIERLTGLQVIGKVPEDENVLKSTNSKVPVTLLYPDSPASQSFYKVAAGMINEVYYPKVGLFKRIFSIVPPKVD